MKITPMGGGLHFQSGPAGIYYKAADKKTGAYTVSASFTQVEPAAHPEAYGLFIGGAGLDGADQKYTLFRRPPGRQVPVKKRAGTATPTVTAWTENARREEGRRVRQDDQYAVDRRRQRQGQLPGRTAPKCRSAPIDQVDASGIAGLRVNHNLNVQVEGFSVK